MMFFGLDADAADFFFFDGVAAALEPPARRLRHLARYFFQVMPSGTPLALAFFQSAPHSFMIFFDDPPLPVDALVDFLAGFFLAVDFLLLAFLAFLASALRHLARYFFQVMPLGTALALAFFHLAPHTFITDSCAIAAGAEKPMAAAITNEAAVNASFCKDITCSPCCGFIHCTA